MISRYFTKTGFCRLFIKLCCILFVAALFTALALYGKHLNSCGWHLIGPIISALAVLGCGWIIIIFSHRFIKSSLFLIITFIALFSYGLYVYNVSGETFSDWWSNIFLPMNSTLSIFFPSRGSYNPKEFRDISFLYTSLHLLSYLYIAMLGLSLFGRRVMNRSANIFIPAKFKSIFWGYSDSGVLLADDIMSKTYIDRVVFVMPEDIPLSSELEKYRFDEVDGIGGIVLYRDFSKLIERPHGANHYFLTEDQDLNVKLAFMVLDNIKRWNNRFIIRHIRKIFNYKPITKIYVRTELAHVDRYFTKVLKSLDGTVQVHTINESELTARKFIEEYPPLEMPGITIDPASNTISGSFKILQLGYGWSGKAILNKLICNTQFKGGNFSATIFDKDLDTLHGFYPLQDSECFSKTEGDINYYNIKLIEAINETPVGSLAFKRWIDDNIWEDRDEKRLKYNRIIVSLGDDAFNVKIALAIANTLNSNEISYQESSKIIFAHIRNRDCCTYFNLAATPISVFGNKDKIYTMDIIVNDKLDKIAMEMNYFYSFNNINDYKAARVNKNYTKNKIAQWHSASILSQDSSRAAAYAIDNTLRLCGLDKTLNNSTTNALNKEELEKRLSKECLYINEHNRWNAFHFTQGIKCWPLHLINYDIFKGGEPKANVIDEINRHAALVSYKQLPVIDRVINIFIERYNKELNGYCAPYNYSKPYNHIDPKDIKYIKGLKPQENIDLKGNDIKFVKHIPYILEHVGYKIVEIKPQ